MTTFSPFTRDELNRIFTVSPSDLLDMVRTLKKTDLPLTYLRQLLLEIFERNFAKQEQSVNDKIRRAIGYVDWLHFQEDAKP
jgi:hypothetical protein